jgi:RimJ/RimL family protein N-acetyltransferase
MSETRTPIIETDRLRLRGHRYGDLNDCVAMWSDPTVTRFIGGKPSTEQQTWSRLLTYVGHWEMLRFGYWVMESRNGGEFIGEIGFADFKRANSPEIKGDPELGFALAARYHGQGYASEAASAVVSWADTHLKSPKTVCMIAPENMISQKIVEKLGYRMFDRGSYNNAPVIFFERLKQMS